ncbi:hypothetical protein SEA_SNAZZY_43 [Mycobacterium phage Snazzy]|nr:hypothetical protein PBI_HANSHOTFIRST_44 [Mycobacterium phage HanShotFirst]AHB31821.1 hypothetical protein PBI_HANSHOTFIRST_44 [Mycobacterium phage HanShotFirst]QAY13256.1 hypothetical protein SEA_PINKPLASTIC_44 [Mycobacterium phage PinkPlastic]QGH75675.1 hypothetical protein SEA_DREAMCATCHER_48 [Mycobacterium phage DreamCatcher]QGJ89844.1 hypothetical protein SEA_SNAZZY_43 [Mycobacterium phage Snazzy]
MKKLVAAALLALGVVALTSCEDDSDGGPNGVIIVDGVPYFY